MLYRARVLSSVDHPAQKFIYEGIASMRKDIKLVRLYALACAFIVISCHRFGSLTLHSFRYNKPELLRALFNNLHAANLASGPISYEDLLPYDQVFTLHSKDSNTSVNTIPAAPLPRGRGARGVH